MWDCIKTQCEIDKIYLGVYDIQSFFTNYFNKSHENTSVTGNDYSWHTASKPNFCVSFSESYNSLLHPRNISMNILKKCYWMSNVISCLSSEWLKACGDDETGRRLCVYLHRRSKLQGNHHIYYIYINHWNNQISLTEWL